MRGGAQSHLMRCSDEAYYVVKFQNNPQGVRILANELLGTRLAARLGLRVPKPYGDYIMLEILRESGGAAVALPDAGILRSLRDWAENEGVFLCPEGAAATAGYEHLLKTGFLKAEDRVVLFNTGAGLKYTDVVGEWAGIWRAS